MSVLNIQVRTGRRKTNQQLVRKKILGTYDFLENRWLFRIANQPEDWVVAICVSCTDTDVIYYLCDVAFPEECGSNIFVYEVADAVQKLLAVFKDICYAIHGISLPIYMVVSLTPL